MQDAKIENILNSLSKSNFRSKFHLKEKDKDYIKEKGIDKIKEHAYDFINKRLAPAYIPNDGKQTPMRGHPVFIAQHATATCCRGCLYKWHKIQPGKELSQEEKDYIVNLIMKWIEKEMKEEKKIIPNKLKVGDEIRVIAPSRSMCILDKDVIKIAKDRLEKIGFKVTFGKNVFNTIGEDYNCATIADRVEDLHDAFKDKNVKAVLTVIGGYNVNQILDYIDYDLIKENPKIICGFSDITALTNAIYTKTGMVTYSGPHFSSFGMKQGLQYTEEYFKKMLMQEKNIVIESSKEWSNDSWFENQEDRKFIKNQGMQIIHKGKAEGKIIGGNLCTLNLLQGTEYMPNLEGTILFIEDDGLVGRVFNKEFDRNLQSLLHCSKGQKIKAIIVGRAETNCEMNEDKWKRIFATKKELKNIPIAIGADFGHTTPIFTFPIGGYAAVDIDKIVKINFCD